MKYIIGNMLEADTQALVNTVNTVGVMGKGIALQFKERFPANFKIYANACKKGEVKIGKMLVVKENTLAGEKIIINFPTKAEWFKKSQYNYIEEGLEDLINVIKEYKIHSIAIPPLGCGNGGLKWEKVKLLMDKHLGQFLDVNIQIYEPNEAVKAILQQEQVKKEVELTPARAMLLHALFKYEKLGEVASVFAANKLAYFLQKSGEPMRLQFVPYKYGPYAQAIEKVLYALNGKYLKGMEQMQAKAF
jgi:O-acetyl-ADP-ribose deacetylase (regulator of RNase III)